MCVNEVGQRGRHGAGTVPSSKGTEAWSLPPPPTFSFSSFSFFSSHSPHRRPPLPQAGRSSRREGHGRQAGSLFLLSSSSLLSSPHKTQKSMLAGKGKGGGVVGRAKRANGKMKCQTKCFQKWACKHARARQANSSSTMAHEIKGEIDRMCHV